MLQSGTDVMVAPEYCLKDLGFAYTGYVTICTNSQKLLKKYFVSDITSDDIESILRTTYQE